MGREEAAWGLGWQWRGGGGSCGDSISGPASPGGGWGGPVHCQGRRAARRGMSPSSLQGSARMQVLHVAGGAGPRVLRLNTDERNADFHIAYAHCSHAVDCIRPPYATSPTPSVQIHAIPVCLGQIPQHQPAPVNSRPRRELAPPPVAVREGRCISAPVDAFHARNPHGQAAGLQQPLELVVIGCVVAEAWQDEDAAPRRRGRAAGGRGWRGGGVGVAGRPKGTARHTKS